MSNKKGLLALSPLFLLIVLILFFTVYSVSKSDDEPNLSLTVAFLIASTYAVIISGGMPVHKRIEIYSRGAGASNLMLMLWIYVLAGAFAASAKSMGAIDATVNAVVDYMPPGLFAAGAVSGRLLRVGKYRYVGRHDSGTCADSGRNSHFHTFQSAVDSSGDSGRSIFRR